MYMDSKKHSAATKAPARITKKVGAKFSAHDGYIKGINLSIVPGRMIVQTWRGSDWKQSDPDSILILSFERENSAAVLKMVHANVPDKHKDHLNQGWKDHYWVPWKQHLKSRRK